MSADQVSPYPGPVDTFIKANPQANGPFTYEEAVALATGGAPAPVVEPEEAPVVVEEAPVEGPVEVVEEAPVEKKVAKKSSSRRKSVDG